jgi:uncharacterized protein
MRRSLTSCVTVVALVACSGGPPPPPDAAFTSPAAEVVFRSSDDERPLAVRIADTDQERERGLMGVRDLPSEEGMAFLFDAPSTGSFSMKDTPIPLAIAFLDEDGHILGITEMLPCRTDPCPAYAAPGPYTMAVEANGGWFGANAVRVGDEAVLLEGA